MKLEHNNKALELRVDEDCIDIYIENDFVGSITLDKSDYDEYEGGYIYLIPESMDFGKYQRQGFYTKAIDTILSYDFKCELESKFEKTTFSIKSVKRTRKACNFWLKRGYGEEYNKEDHLSGNQVEIEIDL